MIDMTKMNKILGYDLENFVVRVEPGDGVTVSGLLRHQAAEEV